ncbi:phosphatidylinositol 3,4,5-trisphosphate 3-phosphatase and protein-tyrosine-phosphatase PTEN1 [Impatiens glandulifera]|uniref:phosphatidylinositol 3,4,5-trisphosphate 3-phosphatase and protein-tyrosine-phosphatase PTEN1 n=1 Tax=Impatiens glandulifera TaxID=253017 RepID=UPI001FB0F4DE|nr:phosphatidylinositol 3,4,5-trisphosphate 3-phosphatase and protein-tyrosine-phosphatase PTEN1 [Impatiens glandulifera]
MSSKMSANMASKGVENMSLLPVKHRLIDYFTITLYIRNLVSKKRRRMLVGGYDLDMSYITNRVLAMSFPAERIRSVYRNPLWQVKSVLDMEHHSHYKVYNLCIEETYDPSHFHGLMERFPFDDNHVPPLPMMKQFCESVNSWLSNDPKNIVVIHCMAGKGRTGLMVCAYLVYTGLSAEEALQLYAHKRTTNNEGVSIPSQRRYVGYWEQVLKFPKGVDNGLPVVELPQPCSRELLRIRLYDTTNIDAIYFVASELQEIPGERYRPSVEMVKNCCRPVKKGSSPRYHISFIQQGEEDSNAKEMEEPRRVVQMETEHHVFHQRTCLECSFEKPIKVSGDVRVIFYEKLIGGRLFYACFNTGFITNSLLQFSVKDLDKIGKRGQSISGPAFCVELLFGPANSSGMIAVPSEEDWI